MDQFLIETFDQLGARLQTRWGIGQPTILKNSALVGIIAVTCLFGISLIDGAYLYSFESVILALWWWRFYLRRRENEALGGSECFLLDLRAEALWQRDWVLANRTRMTLMLFNLFLVLFIFVSKNGVFETQVALVIFTLHLLIDRYLCCVVPRLACECLSVG